MEGGYSKMIDDVQFLIDNVGQNVLIDDVERKVLVTNPTIGEFDTKYIHSLEPIVQGAYAKIDNHTYITIYDEQVKRYDKYKVKCRLCNYHLVTSHEEKILIGYDDLNRPVYEYKTVIDGEYACIVEQINFSNTSNQAVNQLDDVIYLTIQDNEAIRQQYTVNSTINYKDTNLTCIGIDNTKNGLLIYKLQK